jgi:preprotein translocase subunit SecF
MAWLAAIGNLGGRLYRGEVSFDFVGRRKLWYAISGLILVVAIVGLATRGLNYSIDFTGGSQFTFTAPSATTTQIAGVVTRAGGGSIPTVQVVRPPSGKPEWTVQITKTSYAQETKVGAALESAFHLKASSISPEYIGPSWGSNISEKAIEALIAFLIAVVIYLSIAFEWRMASAALVALAHDILITVGVYALTGFTVSPATVIGLLTILGYSLYDTVVVFDKVRENTAGLLGTRKSTYSQAANLALNQTLVRSINTSVIALLPVTAILVGGSILLGNGELQQLALVLLVGMLSGTYSSICIATPVLSQLKEREPQYRQLAKTVALRAAGGRTAMRKGKAAAAPASAGNGSPGRGSGVLTATVDEDNIDNAPELAAAGPPASDPVPARSPASGGSAPRAAGARPGGSRQQPRRSSSARRRPSGKKRRR